MSLSSERIEFAACCDVLMDGRAGCSLTDAIQFVGMMGYDGVELSLAHVLSSGQSNESIRDLCVAHNLTIVGIHNCFPRSVSLFSRDGEITRDTLEWVEVALHTASALGAPVVTLGVGATRRLPLGMDAVTATAKWLAALDSVALQHDLSNCALAIEIISRRTAEFATSVTELLSPLKKLRSVSVGLTCDTFQSIQQGLTPLVELRRAAPWLRHVHIADAGRRPPGIGQPLDIAAIYDFLREHSSVRVMSVELKPPAQGVTGTSDPFADLTSALSYLQSIRDIRDT